MAEEEDDDDAGQNPAELDAAPEPTPEPELPQRRCAGLAAGCGNFAIQYNYTSVSMASAIMLSHWDVTGEGVVPDFPQPDWAKEMLHSAVFIGSVLGMLIMGYLGDVLGIRRALIATNLLVVLGALGSAVLSWGSPSTVWLVVAISRFILGIGAGGNYPLSAAKASESAPAHQMVAKAGNAFFWQGPGNLAPYLLGLALLAMPGEAGVTSKQFRIILGMGAVPSLVVVHASAQEKEPDWPPPGRSRGREGGGKPAAAIFNRKHWATLAGTGGTWFLFDVAFYGTIIFAPNILGKVFGTQQSLRDIALRSAFMSLVGMLGTVSGLTALRHVSPKRLNTVGLTVASWLFAVFMGVHHLLPERRHTLFALLCLLFYTLYAGPNVATYVLPVVSFPRDVRSTFHGLSAAAAKVGAMLGALLFPIVDAHLGVEVVMMVQAVICLLGALLSCCLLSDREIVPEEVAQDEDDGGFTGRAEENQTLNRQQSPENGDSPFHMGALQVEESEGAKLYPQTIGRSTEPFE